MLFNSARIGHELKNQGRILSEKQKESFSERNFEIWTSRFRGRAGYYIGVSHADNRCIDVRQLHAVPNFLSPVPLVAST